jgi:hypothetical protein
LTFFNNLLHRDAVLDLKQSVIGVGDFTLKYASTINATHSQLFQAWGMDIGVLVPHHLMLFQFFWFFFSLPISLISCLSATNL